LSRYIQASTLITALAARRPIELAEAWQAAWNTGPRWKEKLDAGRERLPQASQRLLADSLKRAAQSRKRRQRGDPILRGISMAHVWHMKWKKALFYWPICCFQCAS